jgi:hypothetical protein
VAISNKPSIAPAISNNPAALVAPNRPPGNDAKMVAKKKAASDAELMAGMVLTPIYRDPQRGVQGLVKVVQSSHDPAQGFAHAIFAMMSQARNAIMKSGMPVNGKAWTADGGALDKVIIDLSGLLASTAGPQFVDKKFMLNTKQDVLDIMKQEVAQARGGPPQDGGDEEYTSMPGPLGGGLAAPTMPQQADSGEMQ